MPLCPSIFSESRWRAAVARFHLSPREADIGALLIDGRTVREIADHLTIRPDTVRTYVKRLHDKTGARNSVALIRTMMEAPEVVAG